jgi:hypothetical protein
LEVSISKLEEKSDFITKTSKGARIWDFKVSRGPWRVAISYLQEMFPVGPISPEGGGCLARLHPRAFVIKFLRYQDTVRILSAARAKGELKYGDARIMIFPIFFFLPHYTRGGWLSPYWRDFCVRLAWHTACATQQLCGSKPRMVSSHLTQWRWLKHTWGTVFWTWIQWNVSTWGNYSNDQLAGWCDNDWRGKFAW